jgi:ryanodine receptor 2
MQDYEIVDFCKTQLTLPDKIDPADEMSWQHYLYSKLGSKKEVAEGSGTPAPDEKTKQIEELVERIVAMAKVLYGLHMVRES